MVTIEPISIKTRMTSAALTDIPWASSATVIVSGTATSRVMGSVGFSNACWPAVADVIRRGLIVGLGLRRPRLPSERCNSPPASSRSLDFRFLPFSSRRPPPFASSGGGGATVSAGTTGVSGACTAAASASAWAFRSASAASASTRARSSASNRACSASAAAFASSTAVASFSASSCCRCNSPRRT